MLVFMLQERFFLIYPLYVLENPANQYPIA